MTATKLNDDYLEGVSMTYDAGFVDALEGASRQARRTAGASARNYVAEVYGVNYARAAAWVAMASRRVRPVLGPWPPFDMEDPA